MWKPKTEVVERMEAPSGVAPWRDLTDEEFEALDARFGPLAALFDHREDAGTKKKAAKAAGGE